MSDCIRWLITILNEGICFSKDKECTHIVKINVDAPIVSEDEVSYGIGSLYWLRVTIEGGKEPRIFGCN